MAARRSSRSIPVAVRRDLKEALARFGAEVLAIVAGALDGAGDADRRRRRDVSDLDAVGERVLKILRRSRPLSVGELGQAMGLEPRDLAHPLHRLLAAARVVQTGTRRGARYAAVGITTARATPGKAPTTATRGGRRAKR